MEMEVDEGNLSHKQNNKGALLLPCIYKFARTDKMKEYNPLNIHLILFPKFSSLLLIKGDANEPKKYVKNGEYMSVSRD